MLKEGDVIIAQHHSSKESWWLMLRDERPSDSNSWEKNAVCVSEYVPEGFRSDNPPLTSWDTTVLEEQHAVVVRRDQVTGEMLAQIAKVALLEGRIP